MLLAAAPAHAEPLRSDLPLWGAEDGPEAMWPQSFASDDGDFGCVSRLRFGDWRLVTREDDGPERVTWMRIRSYGVFHCAAVFAEAVAREALPYVHGEPGFLVDLGRAGGESLHALQIGLRGGSRYLLLAAQEPAVENAAARYRVLAADCPARNVRNGPSVGVFLTSYCVVNDRRTMVEIARRAAARPSETQLEYAGDFDPPHPD